MDNRQCGYVYFAQAGDSIKIGSAYNPIERIRTLQTGCPNKIKLLEAVPSWQAAKDEGLLHEKFVNERINGEWFNAAPVLIWLYENTLYDDNIWPLSKVEFNPELCIQYTPEEYWREVGRKDGSATMRKQILRAIKINLMDSKISLVQFCKDTRLPFEEVISA